MSIWSYLWPWSKERQERLEEAKKIEEKFAEQLKEAEVRQFDLQTAVEALRQERERRKTLKSRPPLNSQPVLEQ